MSVTDPESSKDPPASSSLPSIKPRRAPRVHPEDLDRDHSISATKPEADLQNGSSEMDAATVPAFSQSTALNNSFLLAIPDPPPAADPDPPRPRGGSDSALPPLAHASSSPAISETNAAPAWEDVVLDMETQTLSATKTHKAKNPVPPRDSPPSQPSAQKLLILVTVIGIAVTIVFATAATVPLSRSTWHDTVFEFAKQDVRTRASDLTGSAALYSHLITTAVSSAMLTSSTCGSELEEPLDPEKTLDKSITRSVASASGWVLPTITTNSSISPLNVVYWLLNSSHANIFITFPSSRADLAACGVLGRVGLSDLSLSDVSYSPSCRPAQDPMRPSFATINLIFTRTAAASLGRGDVRLVCGSLPPNVNVSLLGWGSLAATFADIPEETTSTGVFTVRGIRDDSSNNYLAFVIAWHKPSPYAASLHSQKYLLASTAVLQNTGSNADGIIWVQHQGTASTNIAERELTEFVRARLTDPPTDATSCAYYSAYQDNFPYDSFSAAIVIVDMDTFKITCQKTGSASLVLVTWIPASVLYGAVSRLLFVVVPILLCIWVACGLLVALLTARIFSAFPRFCDTLQMAAVLHLDNHLLEALGESTAFAETEYLRREVSHLVTKLLSYKPYLPSYALDVDHVGQARDDDGASDSSSDCKSISAYERALEHVAAACTSHDLAEFSGSPHGYKRHPHSFYDESVEISGAEVPIQAVRSSFLEANDDGSHKPPMMPNPTNDDVKPKPAREADHEVAANDPAPTGSGNKVSPEVREAAPIRGTSLNLTVIQEDVLASTVYVAKESDTAERVGPVGRVRAKLCGLSSNRVSFGVIVLRGLVQPLTHLATETEMSAFQAVHTLLIGTAVSVIEGGGGVLHSFSGDRLFCSFNAVKSIAEHRVAALNTLWKFVQIFEAKVKPLVESCSCRPVVHIGLSSAKCYYGDLGCASNKQFGIIGAAPKIAGIMEKLASDVMGPSQSGILVDDQIQDGTQYKFVLNLVDVIDVSAYRVCDARKKVFIYAVMKPIEALDESADIEWMYRMSAESSNVNDYNKIYLTAMAALCQGVRGHRPILRSLHVSYFFTLQDTQASERLCQKLQPSESVPLEINLLNHILRLIRRHREANLFPVVPQLSVNSTTEIATFTPPPPRVPYIRTIDDSMYQSTVS